MVTFFRDHPHKGQRLAVSAGWSADRGWYRLTVTWYAAALNPLPPLIQRYTGAEAGLYAASLFGSRYDCI